MKTELTMLRTENRLRKNCLSNHNQDCVNQLMRCVNNARVNMFEQEVIHKDLIGMALEAEQRGESLNQSIGVDEKQFCRDLLENSKPSSMYEMFLAFMLFFFKCGTFLGALACVLHLPNSTVPFSKTFCAFYLIWPIICFITDSYLRPFSFYGTGFQRHLQTVVMLGLIGLYILFVNTIGANMVAQSVNVNIWLVLVFSAAGWGLFQYFFNRLIHTVAANYHWQN